MADITITPFERRYRQALDDLVFRHYHVHTHLDWQELGDWLDTTRAPIRLAWQQNRLVGVLGVSYPLNHTAWIRFIALHDLVPPEEVMSALWQSAVAELRSLGTQTVSALMTRPWVEQMLIHLSFSFQEEIITMERDDRTLPTSGSSAFTLRSVRKQDMEHILRVDQQAFAPPWQLTMEDMRAAVRIASSYVVALLDEQIIGYQISTVYRNGAHLARLAVLPEMQGNGAGSILLSDTLRRFFRQGIYTMTVNTQESNVRSQQLYRRFGFQRNGYDLPVWTINL